MEDQDVDGADVEYSVRVNFCRSTCFESVTSSVSRWSLAASRASPDMDMRAPSSALDNMSLSVSVFDHLCRFCTNSVIHSAGMQISL